MPDERARLAEAELFRGLSEDQLQTLLGISHIEMIEKERRIFEDGDPGEELFVVLKGRIRISLSLCDFVFTPIWTIARMLTGLNFP